MTVDEDDDVDVDVDGAAIEDKPIDAAVAAEFMVAFTFALGAGVAVADGGGARPRVASMVCCSCCTCA